MLLLKIWAAVVFLIVAGTKLRWHPFFALLITAIGLGVAIGLPLGEVAGTLAAGFGSLLGKVGLLIVLGSIIGVALERAGAARRIADVLLGGGSLPGLRLAVLGAVISVPVFCDSGFIILAALLPAVAARSGGRVAPLALALAGGLYLTHTLVPPTPGPLAAAANLGAEDYVGTIMLLGTLVALPVLFVTWRAAAWLGGDIPATPPAAEGTTAARPLPSLSASLLPLLVPIVLIASGSVLQLSTNVTAGPLPYIHWWTQPTVALLLGSLFALRLAAAGERNDWVADGLSLAGPILIITGLGGAFGAILQASSLADDVAGWVGNEPLSGTTLLLLGFGIAALMKTAQGSSTGALVIASGIAAPLVPLAGFTEGTDLALLTLAIGGGAMTVSHANDSYFWVVSRFSGIAVGDGYRSYTVLTGVMGGAVLVLVLVLYQII